MNRGMDIDRSYRKNPFTPENGGERWMKSLGRVRAAVSNTVVRNGSLSLSGREMENLSIFFLILIFLYF